MFLSGVVCLSYANPQMSPWQNKIVGIVGASLLTDGIFLLFHLPRKPVRHSKLTFDSKKLTIVIACYNGQDVISNTLKDALKQVKANQIIVVSDASTDNTVQIAKKFGVKVIENERNLNKGFSISRAMQYVKTPYVLILDDDTLIGKTFIPTSLLDNGYDAVAFNVMPIPTGSLLNKLQTFEYRRSMYIGKSLRGSVGAVGNVSGAIGLYKTSDLITQAKRHSGQYGGEDQQRTAFVHLKGSGKGVTFIDSEVLTKAPNNLKQFIRQRSLRWNMSLPELFVLNFRILINPKLHYLLKAEKAYKIYLLITDPIKLLYFWIVIFYPIRAGIMYIYYLITAIIVWFKTGKKDSFWLLFIYPLFSAVKTVARFVAELNWLKVKYRYVFKMKYHQLAPERKLLFEYLVVCILLIFIWGMSAYLVKSDSDGKLEELSIRVNSLTTKFSTISKVVAASRNGK